jgi:hypothetical protein
MGSVLVRLRRKRILEDAERVTDDFTLFRNELASCKVARQWTLVRAPGAIGLPVTGYQRAPFWIASGGLCNSSLLDCPALIPFWIASTSTTE